MIRWTKPNRIRHFELVEHIKNQYYKETVNIVNKIKDKLSNSKIKDIIYSYDKYAIKIMNNENKIIGYIPAFFSKAVSQAIDNKRNITCIVINKECSQICSECIKVRLTIN